MKRFFAHIKSESGDDFYFDFWREKMPEFQDEWLDVFYNQLPSQMENQPDPDEDWGPGICGTYLHVAHCQELWMPEETKSKKEFPYKLIIEDKIPRGYDE